MYLPQYLLGVSYCRALQFWEFAQNSTCPERYSSSCPVRESSLTENLPPSMLYTARNRKLTGMLTGVHRTANHSAVGLLLHCTWLVCNSSKPGRKGGGVGRFRDWTCDKKISKYTSKCHFLTSSQKFNNNQKTFCRNRQFFLNLIYKNFVENLKSKLARSTLTSPGTIQV
jgi:hypothetical protein